MAEKKSFKERVKEVAITNAREYKEYYIDYEYLLCSQAFIKSEYYIVTAYADNYLHLTGLHTKLDAATFFEKCYNGTLTESEFDFCKKRQSEKEVKGSVRRKINALPTIMNMFDSETTVEEDFTKNRIHCSFATENVSATLGFIVSGKAKPMTLLKGNELDRQRAKKLDVVLRRKCGEKEFDEIIVGTSTQLCKYKEALKEMLSEELLSLSAEEEK